MKYNYCEAENHYIYIYMYVNVCIYIFETGNNSWYITYLRSVRFTSIYSLKSWKMNIPINSTFW